MDKGLTERMELPGELFEAVGPYLARQRWYAGEGPPVSMNVVEARVLAELRLKALITSSSLRRGRSLATACEATRKLS